MCNLSSYDLSLKEHDAFSYVLDHHIPGNVTRNEINADFKIFDQNVIETDFHNSILIEQKQI